MNIQKVSPQLDNIGITASTLCAIHCAVVPLVFTSLPLIGLGFLANRWVEWGMIILALFIGIYSIGLSYLGTHKRPLPLLMLIAGFAIIMAGHLFTTGGTEAIIVPMGGLLIASAHFVNYRYAGNCGHEHHQPKLKRLQ